MSIIAAQTKRAINKLQSKNLRLLRTIETGFFQEGYIANCQECINSNLTTIKALKAKL